MSDIGELYSALKEVQRDKKIKNIESSLALLRARSIEYKVCNVGNHHTLVAGRYDFWPSTGLWQDRKSGERGRGVLNLIKLIYG